jgi:hypothetical protein
MGDPGKTSQLAAVSWEVKEGLGGSRIDLEAENIRGEG